MRGILLFGRFVPFYGLMIAIGVVAAAALAHFLAKRFELDSNDLIVLEAYAIGGGLLGAKLLSLFQVRDQIDWSRMLEWDYILTVLQGGYVFYGGIFGGAAAVFLAGKLHKIKTLDYLEAVIPCIPLGHGFGRIGCHLASCCYGIPYTGIGHIIYHAPSFAPTGIPLFPVQLLEACLNFALAAGLVVFVCRRGLSYRNILLYPAIYAVERFFLEFLRYDTAERGMFGPLSTSQWISLVLLLWVALLIVGRRYIVQAKKM